MARFTAEQADNYGGSGGGGFFRLVNDGDTATVRFMYNGIEDVIGDSVHEIQTIGKDGKPKKKYVNCLRSYKEPVDVCPFCKAGKPVQAKIFIPVYDEASGQTKTWERGKKFFGKISSLCSRYSNEDTPLVAHTFEIERNGAAGEQTTTYEIYETGCDDTLLEDLPEPANLDGYLLDKSADDMEYYLQNGVFENEEGTQAPSEVPMRRRERSNAGSDGDEAPRRRRREAF